MNVFSKAASVHVYRCTCLKYLNFCAFIAVSEDRATAQAVNRRPLTAEALVRSQVNPSGIYGGENGNGVGSFRVPRITLLVPFLQCSVLVFYSSSTLHNLSRRQSH
jgi:hypothetical protein